MCFHADKQNINLREMLSFMQWEWHIPGLHSLSLHLAEKLCNVLEGRSHVNTQKTNCTLASVSLQCAVPCVDLMHHGWIQYFNSWQFAWKRVQNSLVNLIKCSTYTWSGWLCLYPLFEGKKSKLQTITVESVHLWFYFMFFLVHFIRSSSVFALGY